MRAFGVWPHLVKYANGFEALSQGRVWLTGFVKPLPQSITYSEINAYLQVYGIADEQEVIRFVRYVRAQDRVFVDFCRDERAAEQNVDTDDE